jgi:hypothetical protein
MAYRLFMVYLLANKHIQLNTEHIYLSGFGLPHSGELFFCSIHLPETFMMPFS